MGRDRHEYPKEKHTKELSTQRTTEFSNTQKICVTHSLLQRIFYAKDREILWRFLLKENVKVPLCLGVFVLSRMGEPTVEGET